MPSVDSCVSNIFRDLNFSDTSVTKTVRSYALGILGTPVTAEVTGEAYRGFTVYGVGGVKPYAYSLQGTWPSGLSVDATSGAVSGTASVAGSYVDLSVRVTDTYGVTADLPLFTLTVGDRQRYFGVSYFGATYFGKYA